MTSKIRLLGWIHAAIAGAGLLGGALLCAGLLLSDDQDSRALHYIGPMFLMAAAAYLVPGLAGGIGLLHGRPWARVVLIILSSLMLPFIPVGTIFGAFGLWVLLGGEANRAFSGATQPVPGPSLPSAPAMPWPPRYNGVLLCMAAVASGFVVLLGTGSRLTGQPDPAMIPAGLYFGAILVLVGAVVIGGRWLASLPRSGVTLSLFWVSPFKRRQLRLLRLKHDEERRQRLATLAADPVTHKYVARIKRGESWNDAQIAYNEDPSRLATCVHLQPIERAMRAAGIELRHLTEMNVGATCCVDHVALRRRFALPESVHYTEPVLDQRSQYDPPSAWIVCTVCSSLIDAVHRNDATPETPLFPAPEANRPHA